MTSLVYPKVIYEDAYLIVLDKPSGWIVNESETTNNALVIQSWLKENFDYEIVKSKKERSGIVHRLDKETSGVLIIAKTKESFYDLQKQFRERDVEKKYIALVHGRVPIQEGEIKTPLARLPWNRERFGVLPGGREAVTFFKVEKYYRLSSDVFSLLCIEPKTGRTHQIRVHLKYLGHPIVSDLSYAGRKTARRDRIWCPRLFLHAKEIVFRHPTNAEKIQVVSEVPPDLEGCLENLEVVN